MENQNILDSWTHFFSISSNMSLLCPCKDRKEVCECIAAANKPSRESDPGSSGLCSVMQGHAAFPPPGELPRRAPACPKCTFCLALQTVGLIFLADLAVFCWSFCSNGKICRHFGLVVRDKQLCSVPGWPQPLKRQMCARLGWKQLSLSWPLGILNPWQACLPASGSWWALTQRSRVKYLGSVSSLGPSTCARRHVHICRVQRWRLPQPPVSQIWGAVPQQRQDVCRMWDQRGAMKWKGV